MGQSWEWVVGLFSGLELPPSTQMPLVHQALIWANLTIPALESEVESRRWERKVVAKPGPHQKQDKECFKKSVSPHPPF